MHTAEVSFLRDVLKKFHINTMLLGLSENINSSISLLLKSERVEKSKTTTIGEMFPNIEPNTVYKIKDAIVGIYFLLLLPPYNERVLVIGPYMNADLSHRRLLEDAEKINLDPKALKVIENYFGTIPVIADEGAIFAIVSTFAEKVWGGVDKFTVQDMSAEVQPYFSPFTIKNEDGIVADTDLNMKMMEERYSYENELMQAVSRGLSHKAEVMLSNFSEQVFEKRTADTLRNIKNYCIIMNTLLRKAAENGGVHPLYIDGLSSRYAKEIEEISSTAKISEFMVEVFKGYANLVKKHSISKYSPAVQRTIITVDADLTADLSLSALAEKNNVSAGYLSSVFKKETGETLTDFVNMRRIKNAKKLLKTTTLQVQTVAQHCGILDVHYFTKLFKKYENMTPREYRASVNK